MARGGGLGVTGVDGVNNGRVGPDDGDHLALARQFQPLAARQMPLFAQHQSLQCLHADCLEQPGVKGAVQLLEQTYLRGIVEQRFLHPHEAARAVRHRRVPFRGQPPATSVSSATRRKWDSCN